MPENNSNQTKVQTSNDEMGKSGQKKTKWVKVDKILNLVQHFANSVSQIFFPYLLYDRHQNLFLWNLVNHQSAHLL